MPETAYIDTNTNYVLNHALIKLTQMAISIVTGTAMVLTLCLTILFTRLKD